MKNPTAVVDVQQRGTLNTSTAQALGIDVGGMSMVLSILSNMYSNGSLAVVREYSCNARDSHVEAGNKEPILVSLPTALDPQLRVQDFGLGLSESEILKVYSQYGASTKRDSNTQIGAFGIGSKSAFTVGNQFMVTGVKYGNKTVALFALNESGNPTVQILSRTETDEPNGVLVEVSVEDVNAVRSAAKTLFSTWSKGSVLVNGQAPFSVWSTAEPLSDNIWLDTSEENLDHWESKLIITMGGVPYKVSSALINGLGSPANNIYYRISNSRALVYLNLQIGDADITPSREELRVTDRTTVAVRDALVAYDSLLGGWATKKLNDAKSLYEASRIYRQISEVMKLDSILVTKLSWRGQSFGESYFKLPLHRGFSMVGGRGGKRVCKAVDVTVSITSSYDKTLVVTEVPEGKGGFIHRYGKTWLENDEQTTHLISSPLPSYSKDWFAYGPGQGSDIRTISFDKFRDKCLAIRKEERGLNPAAVRDKTRYEVAGQPGSDLTATEIAALGKKVLIVGAKEGTSNGAWHEAAVKNRTVVYLTGAKKAETLSNRLTKLGIKSGLYATARRAEITKFLDNVSDHDIKMVESNSYVSFVGNYGINWIQIHLAKIKNPKLLSYYNDYMSAQKLSQADTNRLNLIHNAARTLGRSVPGATMSSHPNKDLIQREFPLLSAALDFIDRSRYRNVMDKVDPEALNTQIIEYVNSFSV